MKLLLINPRGPETFWQFNWLAKYLLPDRGQINPPLGLATVAALTPDDWEVEIIDENIEEVPLETDADIVGVTATNIEYKRQVELLEHFRKQGKYTVAGGPYVSLVPEKYLLKAKTLVCGEAERTWPKFCQDWPNPKPLYNEAGTIQLEEVPVPRFDLLKMERYLYATMQFSRGCPFACEFCDAIVMFGRTPRTKPFNQVKAELDELYANGVRNVFFADDNLIGNKKIAKQLFRTLIEWQEENGPMKFGTEASINLAYDDELLSLMREANFDWVFIGIETPDPQTLKNTGKGQNAARDMMESIRKIYETGMHIYAGFIVGFDEDDVTVFDRQYDFIMESGVQVAMISPLIAFPRTPLYARLEKDGRLLGDGHVMDNTHGGTNIIPKNMTYEELIEGHKSLYKKLYTYENIAKRIENKMRWLKDAQVYNDYGDFKTSRKLNAALPMDMRTVGEMNGNDKRLVLKEWSLGLMVKDYVERNVLGGSNS